MMIQKNKMFKIISKYQLLLCQFDLFFLYDIRARHILFNIA